MSDPFRPFAGEAWARFCRGEYAGLATPEIPPSPSQQAIFDAILGVRAISELSPADLEQSASRVLGQISNALDAIAPQLPAEDAEGLRQLIQVERLDVARAATAPPHDVIARLNALPRWRDLDTPLGRYALYRAALIRAVISFRASDFDKSDAAFESAHRLMDQQAVGFQKAELSFWRGQSFAWRARVREALEMFQLASAGWQVLGNTVQSLATVYEIGSLYRDVRNPDASVALLRTLVKREEENGSSLGDKRHRRTVQALAAALVVSAEEAHSDDLRNTYVDEVHALAGAIVSASLDEALAKKDVYRATMALLNACEADVALCEHLLLTREGDARTKLADRKRLCAEIDRNLDQARRLQAQGFRPLADADRLPIHQALNEAVLAPLIEHVQANEAQPIGDIPGDLRSFERVRLTHLAFRRLALTDPQSAGSYLRQTATVYSRLGLTHHVVSAHLNAALAYVLAARPGGDSQMFADNSEIATSPRWRLQQLREAESELHLSYRVSLSNGISLANSSMRAVMATLMQFREAADAELGKPNTMWLNPSANTVPEIAAGAPQSRRGIESSLIGRHLGTNSSVVIKTYNLARLDRRYEPDAELAALIRVVAASGHLSGVPRYLEVRPADESQSRKELVLVSEMLEGRSLRDYMPPAPQPFLEARTERDPNVILQILYDLSETIARLHALGIGCCFLTPTAVLLEPGLKPVIVSYGGIQRGGENIIADLSGAWFRDYCPPNGVARVKRGERPDATWDIYALGVLLAKWIAGDGKPVTPDTFKTGVMTDLMQALTFRKPMANTLRELIWDMLQSPLNGKLATMSATANRLHSLIEYERAQT